MQYPCLLVTDLHLTANPRDEYRWGLFEWIRNDLWRRFGLRSVKILGDLTDAKDNHSSELVNRIVTEMALLASRAPVDVLMGNHDYLKEGHAFFRFLEKVPGLAFIDEIKQQGNALLLPHTRSPRKDWAGLNFSDYQYVFMHQTVGGAIASNGMPMSGEIDANDPALSGTKIYSGDIHVPQTVGNVEYVGSPYHVHFGDRFKARCIVLDAGKTIDVHYPTIQKFVASVGSDPDRLLDLGLHRGDQLKVRVDLPTALYCDWPKIRDRVEEICADLGVDLRGIDMVGGKVRRVRLLEAVERGPVTHTPEEALRKFAKKEGLGDDVIAAGLELIQ